LLDFFESVHRSGLGEAGSGRGVGSPLNSIKEHEGEMIEKKQPSLPTVAEYIVGEVKSPLVASALCGTGIGMGIGAQEPFTIPSAAAREPFKMEGSWAMPVPVPVPIVSPSFGGGGSEEPAAGDRAGHAAPAPGGAVQCTPALTHAVGDPSSSDAPLPALPS
jgi:hypothetical protein